MGWWQLIEAGASYQVAGGTFLVIGANKGSNDNDPLWRHILQEKKSIHIIYVEPVPPLFKALKRNVASNVRLKTTLVNAAITPTEQNLTMYCTGIDTDGNILPNKGFSVYSDQTCTTNRSKLFEFKLNTRAMVERYMTSYEVAGITVPTLLQKYAANRKIRAVQIDVEGLDDMVNTLLWGDV